MKEAAGEANMTVITIILIGVIAAIAIPLVKGTMESQSIKTSCMNAGMTVDSTGKSCVSFNK